MDKRNLSLTLSTLSLMLRALSLAITIGIGFVACALLAVFIAGLFIGRRVRHRP